MASFCLVRRYKNDDQQKIKDIITEATMEQVGSFFWGALFSELLPQIAVVFIAISYILVGIPLKYCLISIPIVTVLIYVAVWLGHFFKANELNNDLDDVSSHYMSDLSTCFYVAVVYGKSGEAEMASLINKVKKVEYNFYNEKEFETKSLNMSGLSQTVVGSIAVTRSFHNSKRAWIRRMAVKKEYRRRGIASRLVREALRFCEEKRYEGVDLITTECHGEAKQLYANEGFTDVEVSHKSYFGIGASQVLYHMYRPITTASQVTKTDDKRDLLMESQEEE